MSMMMKPIVHTTMNVQTLLNTLENERHARGALLVAFVADLCAAVSDRAPESTRSLLQRASRGDVDEVADRDFDTLLDDLRAAARTAA